MVTYSRLFTGYIVTKIATSSDQLIIAPYCSKDSSNFAVGLVKLVDFSVYSCHYNTLYYSVECSTDQYRADSDYFIYRTLHCT